ncbi:DNA-directed RNA polymerase subunit K [Candidatus Woesearchaeota archaeon]|nr:DNA-directed RNA polymerase subunit K [Candidatus Woesearchaeota archaeon]
MEREKKLDYTKYEKARMLGSRALQIAMGAPFLIKLEEKDLKKIAYSPLEIAKLEFKEGIIPLTVRRPLPKKLEEEPEKK